MISKESQKIFGAYTDIPLKSKGECTQGKGNSFLYTLINNNTFRKLKCIDPSKEIHHNSKEMLGFGSIEGLWIYD